MCIIFYSLMLLCALTSNALEKTFDLKSGPYELRISQTYKYTVRQIKYENTILGTQTGFCGTVMAHKKGKFVGAGHSEGGTEKVLKVELIIDGYRISPVIGRTYKGGKILLRKTSILDKLRFQSEITLSPEAIVERKYFTATAKQSIYLIYIYLLCWNKSTDAWIAKGVNGENYLGKFNGDFKGKSRLHLRNDIKWVANIDYQSGKSMLMYYPTPIKGKEKKSFFWEVPKLYNKYYLMLKTPSVYPAGYVSPIYTLILKAFNTNQSSFPKDAEEAAQKASKIKLPVFKNYILSAAINNKTAKEKNNLLKKRIY